MLPDIMTDQRPLL